MQLMGRYAHTLDAKNRVFIPAKHREILGDRFVIIKNVDDCLSVYSMEEWEKYTARINELPRTQAREIRRFVFSGAATVEPDSQGRVPINEELRKFAGIEKNVVILGCGEYAEIWAEDARLDDESEANTERILNTMIEAGL